LETHQRKIDEELTALHLKEQGVTATVSEAAPVSSLAMPVIP
jgi:hypothetical protein